ncbi:hypothetical protein RFI_00437, partial [Reticulomyxa filosa]
LLEQSRLQSRTDYCFDMTVQEFPYVYGYTIFDRLYTTYKYEQVSNMVNTVINYGVKSLIDNAEWMDSYSRQNCDDKLAQLANYIGFPEPIQNATIVSQYYQDVDIVVGNYLENLGNTLDFDALQQKLFFSRRDVNMTGPWPTNFSDPTQFPYWFDQYVHLCLFFNCI